MKEELHFGYKGNGVTVWDSKCKVNNDYPTIAHIDYDRKVAYRTEVSPKSRTKIGNFARYENLGISDNQPDVCALSPITDSAFMSMEEKDDFLRDYGCAADGVEPFIREVWDDTKSPMENLELFRQWWCNGAAEKYLG